MSIWETVQTALSTLGLPMAANTMVPATSAALPAQYLVYQLISDPPALHADDTEQLTRYRMQVSFYSTTGLATVPGQIETEMLAAGFTRLGSRELPYNSTTRHYGLAMDFSYLED